jgi:hypothetical protein
MLPLQYDLRRATLLHVRRNGDARDREAHQLPLAAPQAPHRIAHQEDIFQVLRAQRASTKSLARAKLALNRNTLPGMDAQKHLITRAVRGVWPHRTTL